MKKNLYFFKEQGGITLIFVYSIAVVLLVLFIALTNKVFFNKVSTTRNVERIQALHIAEAGLDYALAQLQDNYNWSPAAGPVGFESGEFFVTLTSVGSKRLVQSTGFIPAQANFRESRVLEVWIKESIPSNFYDNAIYSGGNVDLNGSAYTIDGDVVYYSEIDNTGNVTGSVTQDDSASPLAMLDFEDLYNKSLAQGNVYDEQRLQTDPLPTIFWNIPPNVDPNYPQGIPNFVYVETDLVLNGNINIGGFFIVVGDVLNNASAQYDAAINGNGQIDGCIYTRGEFRINGGAGGLNINGGVWSGTEIRINGNATIEYNQAYMDAIAASVQAEAQTVSWREIRP